MAMTSRKRAFTVWANFRLQTKDVQVDRSRVLYAASRSTLYQPCTREYIYQGISCPTLSQMARSQIVLNKSLNQTPHFQLNNVFVELFKGFTMKQLVESITGNEIRKLNSWDNLSSAQVSVAA